MLALLALAETADRRERFCRALGLKSIDVYDPFMLHLHRFATATRDLLSRS